VAKVRDGGAGEGALGAFEEELVALELADDGVDVSKVIRPCPAVD
jgi:hypothetical protein